MTELDRDSDDVSASPAARAMDRRSLIRAGAILGAAPLPSATAEALAQLCWHAGLPDGVLNLVQADGPATFDGLAAALEDGLVDKVGFTGSTEVGRRIG